MAQRTDLPRKTKPGPKPEKTEPETIEELRDSMVIEGLKAQRALYMLSLSYSEKASVAEFDQCSRLTDMAVETYLAAESVRT